MASKYLWWNELGCDASRRWLLVKGEEQMMNLRASTSLFSSRDLSRGRDSTLSLVGMDSVATKA
jgi:hypothetical protein